MPSGHDIRIVDTAITLQPVPFRAPLKFGGRIVDQTKLINVSVTVERSDGRRATGTGSMPVGNVWAWPTATMTVPQGEAAMIAFARLAAESLDRSTAGHPVELMARHMERYASLADQLRRDEQLPEAPPPLARLVAASALDAAVHDAYGRVHHANSYQLLGRDYLTADLSEFLSSEFRGDSLADTVLPAPKASMPLYHLVGALDPLLSTDIEKPIADGLPETLVDWINADGLTHLKIKLSGEDFDWDVDRVLSVEQAALPVQQQCGSREWWYSCDFNEKCESIKYVIEFLKAIERQAPQAFARIQYIEQPMPRDLGILRESVTAAARLKPVVIDESLVDYAAFKLARELGYTGVALKACKGHTESLLMAAAARKHQMFLCVQDLTCPGQSFLHSASLAAWIPGVAAIEGNGRQYCPAPNAQWAARYPGLFSITDGSVRTGELSGEGLGFACQ